MMADSRLNIIAAIGKNRELGLHGKLLWHIPEDMRRFKEVTTGHPVIMGRKTWESLPQMYRPLPGRTNIVVTRQVGYKATGAIVADSLKAARIAAARAGGADEIFVIGGGELYRRGIAAHRPPLSDSGGRYRRGRYIFSALRTGVQNYFK